MMWKFCETCTLPQNFHIRKLGEISVFCAVSFTYPLKLPYLFYLFSYIRFVYFVIFCLWIKFRVKILFPTRHLPVQSQQRNSPNMEFFLVRIWTLFTQSNTRTMCEICSKIKIKILEDVIDLALMSLLLTLNRFHTLF